MRLLCEALVAVAIAGSVVLLILGLVHLVGQVL